MVSECHCCQGLCPSEKVIQDLKNEINFNNLKLIAFPGNLFQGSVIGFCHLESQETSIGTFPFECATVCL